MLGNPPPTSPSPVRELPATPEALRHSALSQKSARTRRAYRLDVQHLMRTQQRSDIPEEQIWLDKHHRYRRPVAPRLCAVCVGHRCDRPRPVPGVDAPCPGTKSSKSIFLQRGVGNEPCGCRGCRTRVGPRVRIHFAPAGRHANSQSL